MLEDLKKALKDPEGDFVEEYEDDPTAKTQVINTSEYAKAKKKRKENKFVAFVKKHKILATFIIIVLLFTVSLGGTMMVLNITNPPEVELPNVVGLTKEEAQEKVEAAKLNFEFEEEYDSDVEEGYVISQSPKYMEKYNNVKQGSTVTVVVSKGKEKTTVPKVVGMTKDEAINALEDAKLNAEIVEETSKKVEEGYVVSQEIEANTEAAAGDTVKIHVSTGTGIKQVTMIDVTGKSEEDAKSALEALGLVVNIGYSEDSSKDNGIVLKQTVELGKVIDEGTTVTITVNKITETKTATVTIDVKSLTGGYSTDEDEEETDTSKTVNIELKYGDKVETRSGIDKNKTCQITLSGKSGESKDIQLTIKDATGTIYSSSQTIKFGSQDEVTFSK
jgi:serine/threonine-protein kinase